jgi:hypothetical protein
MRYRFAPLTTNYRLEVSFVDPSDVKRSTPFLDTVVEAFHEYGILRYRAVLARDRLVFGYGDSAEAALEDLAEFLLGDYFSLADCYGRCGLTEKAHARLQSLRELFGVELVKAKALANDGFNSWLAALPQDDWGRSIENALPVRFDEKTGEFVEDEHPNTIAKYRTRTR